MQSGGTGVNDVIFDHHFVSAKDAKLSPSNDFIITMSLRGVSGSQTLGGQVVMWHMVARRRLLFYKNLGATRHLRPCH